MDDHRGRWAGLGLLALAVATLGTSPARAQVTAWGGYAANTGYVPGGLSTPNIPVDGIYMEVVTVTPRWLVLQNRQGQQFPVPTDSVGNFMMRWPTSPELLGNGALAEATGVQMNNNQIMTDHVDVYEGAERALVSPTLLTLVGYNRVMTGYDINQMQIYGVRYFMRPEEYLIPQRLHVVGPIEGLNPLRVGVGGINFISVFPSAAGINMMRVTKGALNQVRRGDLAYVVPAGATLKGVALSQLVIYKKVPFGTPDR